ncbi:PTR2-domain-containing protein [Punctularia strigosozonata HHB-11173 SS5]|uniref:PTR2-domain-containing protein n=1 Tax=Punctularia strigosozonata (strain HHB-11173) TaxID=741275 RepID=R7S460_PUNST|nr:PTR2-domain-containing protein [Punctularia strigosozonata HHB-11173 SS5]EIN04582.1 PTR2-domain-containing protein [Punctularia strigosozonata HHB-11173 SS5]
MAGLEPDRAIPIGVAEAAKDEVEFEKKGIRHSESDSGYEVDHAHEGLEFPTEEEKLTLRRVSDSLPWAAYMIATVELAERFSYYGSTVVFTNFIQQPLPSGTPDDPGNHRTGAGGAHGQSGALGLGQRASTGLTTFNSFWVYVIPLFGAYIADTYWGRFKTVCVAVGIAMFGHVLLIISAVPGVIEHSNGALACFVIAIVIMGLGTGGFKSNISPLVAEQYKRSKLFISTTAAGERVIVDPVLTTSRIYMYFYLFTNIGALIGQIGMTYSEKYVGFWLAYMLPTVVFFLCPLVLFFGRNRYTRSPPTGSILGTALRLWRYAARGRWSWNPVRLVRNLTAPDFWDSAKPSKIQGERPSWMTFDDVWVDEVKRGLKACTVFLWYPIYWLTYNQLNNNLTSQAATMQTHGLPNDVLSNLDPFALIILIPICDIFIYPALRRVGIHFTPIKKITLGFFTGAAAMIWAAVLQHYIYKKNPCGYHASACDEVAPINVWAQTGAYVLIAISEILASITGLEYAFTKAPKNMRSLVMSVYLFMSAISSALGEAFVSLSADPLLVWNYGVMAVLAGVAGIVFWFAHRHLDAAEDELNAIDEGHVEKH